MSAHRNWQREKAAEAAALLASSSSSSSSSSEDSGAEEAANTSTRRRRRKKKTMNSSTARRGSISNSSVPGGIEQSIKKPLAKRPEAWLPTELCGCWRQRENEFGGTLRPFKRVGECATAFLSLPFAAFPRCGLRRFLCLWPCR